MPETAVAIEDGDFPIDGRPTDEGCTYDGHRIEGLPFDARTVEALFDDADLAPRDRWAPPDTGGCDPERNVREFCAVVPTRRAHGLRAVIANLQCGSPEGYSDEQPRTVSAYRPDGSLKSAWLDRLERVLDAADRNGPVVILGPFYFG